MNNNILAIFKIVFISIFILFSGILSFSLEFEFIFEDNNEIIVHKLNDLLPNRFDL